MFTIGKLNVELKTFLIFFHHNRQNTRLYDVKGMGAPEAWCTEQGQGEPKIMVFHVIYGELLL